jgi:hypothetical protein
MAETAIVTTKSSTTRYNIEAFLKLMELPADFIWISPATTRATTAPGPLPDFNGDASLCQFHLRDMPHPAGVPGRNLFQTL